MTTPSQATLTAVLEKNAGSLAQIFARDLNGPETCRLDFTAQNKELEKISLENTAAFSAYVEKKLAQQQATIGLGGYLEPRVIYRRSALFAGAGDNRSVHLGVDVWTLAETPVFAPLAGQVHSFADNAHFGDYGPTIILEHQLENVRFYTLYGHLSRRSLRGLYEGKAYAAGEPFTELGPFPENGDWPPHLHFQIITDLQGRRGDFPGVFTPEEVEQYRAICPDPNLILKSDKLKGTSASQPVNSPR